ncbi:MAG: RNA polymerase sporulation sigma factor SigG [Firmicutes bacterium]|nr:RNA polymerase sporulation sigma factor SigG [Bacillota bacterium]
MSNKVVICGVNTAELPYLKRDEMVELMLKIKQGDLGAKSRFIYGNMRLVLSVVQRFMWRKENCDDIFQVGCVGLIKAIDNFDITIGVRFSTYAVPMIIGEIRRFLRDNNAVRVSRSLRDIAYRALQSHEKLEASLSREPTLEEIALDLELPYREVACALDAISEPVSLNEAVYSDESDSVRLMDHIADDREVDDKWIESVSIKDAMINLDERERRIIQLRYFLGKTQIEVSDEVGISQAQVSRLEKNALEVVRKYLV